MKILHVVGARPNFMKTAPIMAELAAQPKLFQQVLVHTGQHYDYNMSKVFFEELLLPEPDEFLNVGSGSHVEQTAKVMQAFEPVLIKYAPDWVIVVGDVNSTLACALVCAKQGVKAAHVEAGLRSRDRTMPEEINRLLTDQIADLLLTPSLDARANLLHEGIAAGKIHFVGNVMIDSLMRALPKARLSPILSNLNLDPQGFILVTLHRPSNVDQPDTLRQILTALLEMAQKWPIIFPVHPRTRHNIELLDLKPINPNMRFLKPAKYTDFLAMMNSARLVITDSGGVQEETTYLGVPCLTVRPNTERPITIEIGTNRLVASSSKAIVQAAEEVISRKKKEKTSIPELWDGHTAQRIGQIMRKFL